MLGNRRQFIGAVSAVIGTAAFHPSKLIAAEPLAQKYTEVFHNPDPEYYVEGPGLVRLADGTLVAVVPIVPRNEWSAERRATRSVTHILHSKGGTKVRNDDLLLLRSKDGGKTWSEPVTLFKGHFWNCHTGMAVRDNHLYWALDDLSLGSKRGPRAVAGDLSGDLMDPKSWRLSEPVPFPGVPEPLTHPDLKLTSQYLEPNVLNVRGKLRVLMTVKPKRQSTASLCAVLDLNDDQKKLDLKFKQFHPMAGGQLKFCVLWDEVSQMFWATANLVVDSQGAFDWWAEGEKRGNFSYSSAMGGNDRRFLMLFYGIDGLNWMPAGCIAQAGKISQSFMYARPAVDGDDLAIIARSSVNAPNQHDADYATFHRVRDFRKLALKLTPEPEGK
ncbi:MAG: glycosyl hydrolase [Verrucomicrobia bacterium]|nr:glycosyl hydrolase [Verrucomicrobiota bacterium]